MNIRFFSWIVRQTSGTRHLLLAMLLGITVPLCDPSQVARASPEGKRLQVESIEFQGIKKTRPWVLMDYLEFREGDSISKPRLEAAEQRLRETNFFKQVSILVAPGTSPGRARVTVQVQERGVPFLQFRSGFNELDGWYLSPLGIRLDNLFGRGMVIGAELLIGDRINGTRLELRRPHLWRSEYDLGVELFSWTHDYVHFVDGEERNQEVRNQGLRLELKGNSGLARFFSLAYVAQQVSLDTFLTRAGKEPHYPLPPKISFLLPSAELQIRRVVLSFTVDTRDHVEAPHKGWWGGLVLDQSASSLKSFADYFRLMLDLRRYQPLVKQVSLAMRIQWGRVSMVAPFFEKFYLGGPNSLRGYQDRSLTPLGYAAHLTLAQVELRFPLSARLSDPTRLTGVLFFDTGQAWNPPERWARANLKSALGYGLRARLPLVGMVRADFAYAVPGFQFQFHLSLGHTF